MKSAPPRVRRSYAFVYVGQPVLWYPSGNTDVEPLPAFVCKVGEMALNLAVYAEGWPRMKTVEGVRHVDERDVGEAIRMESGGWDHTDGTVRLYARAKELATWPGSDAAEQQPQA